MTSRDRILAALNGEPADYTPLTTWCFGFPAPESLRWRTGGCDVTHWYSKRLEHLHKLPRPWRLEDDFKRAESWLALGIDDILDVSVPWSQDAAVAVADSVLAVGDPAGDDKYPVMVRQYETPSGPLRHAVQRTGDEGPGWPIQPDCVPLIEDYNIPRAVEHGAAGPADVSVIKHLFAPPNDEDSRWFADRMSKVRAFAREKGLLTQAWTAFGMDAAVWFTGTQGAIMMALDYPDAFAELIETIAETDRARTELAANTDGVDMVCQRGWYSSTDFWSPVLFDRYVYPHVADMASIAHKYGKKFAYVMTTGVAKLGPRLADAGVDLLYFVDPDLDEITLEEARDLFGTRMTVAGGMNSRCLACGDPQEISRNVQQALEVLGPTNRFILHPTDAIFPDTPFEGVEQMIAAWKKFR